MIKIRSDTVKLLALHASYQRACTHMSSVSLTDLIVFVRLSLNSYGLCMLDLYMRARARWPNVAQIDLTVVVVIVVVVVTVIVDKLRRYCCF